MIFKSEIVQSVFEDQIVFLTGGSGFLGKYILLYLLQAELKLKKIYLLIRSKNGISSEDRFNTILRDKFLFNYDVDYLEKKIIVLDGDLTKDCFGLSNIQFEEIASTTNIFINNAAIISWHQSFEEAMNNNFYPIYRFSKYLSKFKSISKFVNISTAYVVVYDESNPYRKEILPNIPGLDIELFIKTLDNSPNPADAYKILQPYFNISNFYVVSKIVSELVLNYFVTNNIFQCKVSIVRPSLILPPCEFPKIGQVDDINSALTVGFAVADGSCRLLPGNGQYKMDSVPVDHVAIVALLSCCADYEKLSIFNAVGGSSCKSYDDFFSMIADRFKQSNFPEPFQVGPVNFTWVNENLNDTNLIKEKFQETYLEEKSEKSHKLTETHISRSYNIFKLYKELFTNDWVFDDLHTNQILYQFGLPDLKTKWDFNLYMECLCVNMRNHTTGSSKFKKYHKRFSVLGDIHNNN